MIRTFLVEFIFPLLLFLFLRSIVGNLIRGARAKTQSEPRPVPTTREASVPAGGELKKDPVCGTYVSTAASLTRTVRGEVMYFCSKECRDKYRAA